MFLPVIEHMLCSLKTLLHFQKRISILRAALAVLLMAGGMASCIGKHAVAAEEAAAPLAYPVISPIIMDVSADRQFVADIQTASHIELCSRVGGFIEKLEVDEGQRVTKGQLLFGISNQAFQVELLSATAKFKSAQAEAKITQIGLSNSKTLLEKKIVSQTEFDLAQAQMDAASAKVDEAHAEVVTAERRISYAEVRAPFDGMINRLPKKVGSMVAEGDVLTTLCNDAEVNVYFNVSEAEYLELSSRQDLTVEGGLSLELADGRKYAHTGRIQTSDATIDKTTGTIAFRGRFPNPEHLLRQGASGKVTIHNRMHQVMVIPQKCTFEVQHKLCVYRLGKNNKVELCTVEPVLRLPNHFVIGAGLDIKDKIIFEGIQRVREGEVIVPEERVWQESMPL